MATTVVGSIDIQALLKSDEFLRGLKELQREGESSSGNIGNSFKALSKTAAVAFAAVATAVKAVGVAALRIGGDFQDSMASIRSTTGMTAEDIGKLNTGFRDLALRGGHSANEIAKAMSSVAVSGQSVSESLQLMEKSMVLADAVSMDLADATSFLSLALMKTGADTSKAEKYINAFAMAASLSGMSMAKLQEAIITLAPTMNASGASIEEMSGALTILYRGGISGVAAGRGLEQIFNQLVSPSNAAASAIDTLGIEIFDAAGNMRPFNDILLETMGALEDVTTEQERLNLQNDLFSTVYSRAVFAELQNNKKAWQANIQVMYEAGDAFDGLGQAFGMAEMRGATFSQSFGLMRNSLQDMLLTLFEIIEGPLGEIVRNLGGVFADLAVRIREGGDLHHLVQSLGESISRLGLAFGGLIETLVPLVINVLPLLANIVVGLIDALVSGNPVIWGIVAAFAAWKIINTVMGLLTGLKVAFAALNAVMLANPIGLIAAAVAGLVVGLGILATSAGRVSEAHEEWRTETDKLLQSHEALMQSIEQTRQVFDDTNSEIERNAEYLRNLADSATYLAGKQELSTGEMVRLLHYISELNGSVPGLSLAYNEQTGALNMTNAAMNSYIEASRAQLQLDAQLQRGNDLHLERVGLKEELAEQTGKLLEVQRKLNEDGGFSGTWQEFAELQQALMDFEKAIDETNASLAANAAEHEELATAIEATSRVVDHFNRQQADSSATEANNQNLQNQINAYNNLVVALGVVDSAFDRHYETATAALRGVGGASMQTAADMLTALDSNYEVLRQQEELFSKLNNIAADAEFSEEFIQHLRRMVEQNPSALGEILDDTNDYLARFYEAYQRNMGAAADVAIAEFDLSPLLQEVDGVLGDIEEFVNRDTRLASALAGKSPQLHQAFADSLERANFGQLADYIVSGFVGQNTRNLPQFRQAGNQMGRAVADGFTEVTAIQSPSKLFMEFGDDIADGFIIGTENRFADIGNLGTDFAEAFTDGVTDNTAKGFVKIEAAQASGMKGMSENLISFAEDNNALFLQNEMRLVDEQIRQIQTNNREIQRARELENRQRAVDEARDADARLRAQEQLNDLLLRNELEALQERRNLMQQQLRDIENAYNEMNRAITAALRNMHTQSRDSAIEALRQEHSEAQDLLSRQVEARKDAVSRQLDAIRAGTREAIELYKQEFDARISLLNAEESGIIGDLQAQIDALDAQTNAEERAIRERQDIQRLADLQMRIDTAESHEERIRAQEAFNTEMERQQRAALLQSRRDQQAALREQIQEVRQNYSEQRDMAREEHDTRVAAARETEQNQVEHFNNLNHNIQEDYRQRQQALDQHLRQETQAIEQHYAELLSKESLEAQARKLMVDNNQEEIIRILNSYLPDWATAGMSAGQNFLNALQGITPSIEGEVAHIMNLVNQAQQATQQLQAEQMKINTMPDIPASFQSKQSTQSASSPPPITPTPPPQQPQTYVVQQGDTLYAIAGRYGVSVAALRNENGLRPEDDRRLPIGRVLRIPILHEGGLSLKEQFALIDKHEAVTPMATLNKMMENAVKYTADKIASGFIQNNNSNATTTNNNNSFPMEMHMHYSGEGYSRNDVYNSGRMMSDEIARQLRSRGLPIYGGR